MQIQITNSTQSGPEWRVILQEEDAPAPLGSGSSDYALPLDVSAEEAPTQEVRIIPEGLPRIYPNWR